jgi:outer membrane protein TolC
MRDRRRLIARLWAPAVLFGSWAGLASAENLQDAWALANTRDQRLESSRHTAIASGLDASAAKAERLPKLQTWTASAFLTTPLLPAGLTGVPLPATVGSNQENFTFSLTTIGVPLYTGGRIKGSIAAKAAQANASRAEQFSTSLDLRLDVARAYVGVLRAEKALAVTRSSVSSLTAQARDVTNLVEQGRRVRNDLLAAQVALANARQREIQQNNNLNIAWATYNRNLRRPLGTVVALQDFAAPPAEAGAASGAMVAATGALNSADEFELQRLTQLAVRIRSEPAQLQEQARAQQAQARVERAAVKPQLTFYVANIYQNTRFVSSQPDIGAAAFVVNWTPFDGGKAKRTAQALEHRAMALCSQRADLVSNIELQIRSAWLNVRETRLRLPVTRAAVEQAEENLRVARSRYVNQRGTNTEVLDAEASRVQSYDNYYNAVYDGVVAEFELHRAVGDL